jgi:thiamine biosynthesis lipoprotein
MGTVFTIAIRTPGEWDDAVAQAVAWLHHVDDVFSTYKPGSDISRLARRELRLDDAHRDVLDVLEMCAEVQLETHGYFTATPNGLLDPTGLVKGWAIERASLILREHGALDHAVNGGGDIQVSGDPSSRPWRIGIADPRDRSRLLAAVTGSNFAVATSGTAERGQHILDPFTRSPVPPGYLSATVKGPSLTRADAYATAAFAMGRHALQWANMRPGYEALLVDSTGETTTTAQWSGFIGGSCDLPTPSERPASRQPSNSPDRQK